MMSVGVLCEVLACSGYRLRSFTVVFQYVHLCVCVCVYVCVCVCVCVCVWVYIYICIKMHYIYKMYFKYFLY